SAPGVTRSGEICNRPRPSPARGMPRLTCDRSFRIECPFCGPRSGMGRRDVATADEDRPPARPTSEMTAVPIETPFTEPEGRPDLVALLPLAQHIPEWLKNRNRWYGQTFNICNYVLDSLAALAAARWVASLGGLIRASDVRHAVAGLAACVVFVALNHTLLAIMLRLGPGHSLRETGLFSFESLSTDLVLATLGVGVAAFWSWNPWLIPFAIAPLLLVHLSLCVPALQADARVD